MFMKIISIFRWIWSFWANLSEETKDNIINKIIDVFEEFMRGFYRAYKERDRNKDEKNK